MQRLLSLGSLVVLFALSSAHASAQETAPSDSFSASLADARRLEHAGMGLTLAGLGTTALGVSVMMGAGGLDGMIAGGVLAGLGALATLIGIPTWVAAAVRTGILGARERDRAYVASRLEDTGVFLTLFGIAICVGGGAMLAAGMLDSSGPHQGEQLRGGSGLVIPLGILIATIIGAPLWAEGARF